MQRRSGRRKGIRAKTDDLDRMVARHRRDVPDFDSLLAKELADLDLALAIAKARQARHLSQRDLARLAGLTQAMVARLENPKNTSATLKTLAALATALGCRLRIAFEPKGRRERGHTVEQDRAA